MDARFRRRQVDWPTPTALLELPVYLAIVCAMALVAAQSFARVRQHLQVFEIVSFVSGAKIGMMEYHAVTGNWPASNGEMGVGSLTSLIQEGGPPSAIIRGGGAMDITMSDRKNGLNGKALTIRAWQGSDSDTPVAWMCGHAKSSVVVAAAVDRTTLADDELPSPCRERR